MVDIKVISFPLTLEIKLIKQVNKTGKESYFVAINGAVAGYGGETLKEAIENLHVYKPMTKIIWDQVEKTVEDFKKVNFALNDGE